jgi:fucose permease
MNFMGSTAGIVKPARRSRVGLIVLAYIAFISLGLPDGLFGVAWPSIRANFSIPLDSMGALLFAGMLGYTTSSFFSGRIMARLGIGGLLAASCCLTGSVLLGFTLAPAWWVMVALDVFGGLGAGAIDAGINTYIASEHSDGLMQWLHASFGVGITLGPIIMTGGLNFFNSWRLGYIIVGVAQVILGLCFLATAPMWKRGGIPTPEENSQRLMDYETSMWSTLAQPRVWLSFLLFFIYTGLELILGHWAYTLLTESRGIAPGIAGLWAGSYWATFTLGRVLAGLYTKRIGLHSLVRGSLALALVGALLLWWNPAAWVSLLGVALTGFAIAPIFPALVSGTRERVGVRHAANTIGMQIAAAGLGGAGLPGLAGVLAQRINLEAIPGFLTSLFALLLAFYSISILRKQPENGEVEAKVI